MPDSSSSSQGFLKAQKRQSNTLLTWTVALGTFGGCLLIAQAWCLAQVVDGVVFGGQSLADVMPWLWAMLNLIVLRAGLVYLSEQFAFAAASQVKDRLRKRLYQHIQALGPAYLSEARSGELAILLSEGIEALEAYYARYLPAMSLAALLPLSILVFVIPFDWQSALVLLLTAPLIPFFMILVGKGAEKLNQAQWQKLQRMAGHFLDVVQGLDTLHWFNATRREAKMIARISEQYHQATMRVLRVAFLSALALEFFATISIAIVAVLIGFRLLFGEMDFLFGFFVLLLAPEFYLPLRNLGTQYHARMQAIGAAEGILQVLDKPLPSKSALGNQPVPSGVLSIRFEQLSFAYSADTPILRALDVCIQPGERVALVGASGAGKTTLINLLLGFIQPNQGRILLNEHLLGDIDLAEWRRCIAWVPQNPRLIHGSVRENIALGLDHVSLPSVELAAQQANILDFIRKLPQGLETLVGEGGRGLSGGQIQRIALARAMLRDARLVLLDEATAHLDAETEHLVQSAIVRLTKGKTSLIVAHRLNTVRQADRILVLDKGCIVEQGRHSELMQQQGLYCQLVEAQEVIR